MYSLLMMAAMATSPDTSNFGWRFAGCTGCTGYTTSYGSCYGSACYGSACYGSSCYGSSCLGSSCHGSSCYGSSCHGGGLFPRLRGLFSGLRPASCFGSSCLGSSCHGSSCLGSSCYGAVHYGVGCYGSSCYGSTVAYPAAGGCTGCSGVIVGSAVPVVPAYGNVIDSTINVVAAKPAEPTMSIATLVLELPASASLFVDGQPISGEGSSRSFHTPALALGQTYYYDFKAEVVVDGKTEVEEKRIVVRAGDSLTESFPKLIAMVKTVDPTTLASK